MKRITTVFFILLAALSETYSQGTATAYFDILLSQQIMDAAHMKPTSFLNNIGVTVSQRLMLASRDSLYLFGYGGYVAYKPEYGKISMFTTDNGAVYYVTGRNLVKLSSSNGEMTFATLSFRPAKIWTGKDVVYVSSQEKGRYSLYVIPESGKKAKRFLVTNNEPIAVFERGGVIYVITTKELLIGIARKGKYATVAYPSKLFSNVNSAAIDQLRECLYLSCDKGLFRFFNGEFQKVSTDQGTLCYDEDGLLIFNPAQSSVIRLRNNFLYPKKEQNEIIIEIR